MLVRLEEVGDIELTFALHERNFPLHITQITERGQRKLQMQIERYSKAS